MLKSPMAWFAASVHALERLEAAAAQQNRPVWHRWNIHKYAKEKRDA